VEGKNIREARYRQTINSIKELYVVLGCFRSRKEQLKDVLDFLFRRELYYRFIAFISLFHSSQFCQLRLKIASERSFMRKLSC